MQYYSTFEACKILGIKRERLKEWMTLGHINPSAVKPWGNRLKSLFDIWALYRIRVFMQLQDNGFSRGEAARISEEIIHHAKPPTIPEKVDPEKRAMLEWSSRFQRNYITLLRRGGEHWKTVLHETGKITLDVSEAEDFDDALTINFGKVRREIDARL